MALPRLNIPDRIRAHMAYRKLAGGSPRLLILESQYWLDGACRSAAEALGWPVCTVPVLMEGVLPREGIGQLLHSIVDFRPDLILSINLSGMDEGGLFARLFEDLEVPYVTWFVDDPRTIIMERTEYSSSWAIALTWERAYSEYLRAAGFPVVETLPLAVDPAVFDGPPSETSVFPPTFVGNSMVESSTREWDWITQYPDLESRLREAFDQGLVTRERFGAGLRAILGQDAVAALDAEQRRHIELLCFVEGTRRLRHDLVRALAPEGLVVRGDDLWEGIHSPRLGSVNYYHDLAEVYRGAEVNLNATSIQMATAVNQRVFDCPAAGGFLLTDAQSSLNDLFDEGEVAVYTSPAECVDLLHWYRQHPSERVALVRRAQARIQAEHTYRHRLQRIVEIVRDRFEL